MADGTTLRTTLGAISALGLGAVGLAVVPPLLGPREPALETQVAALPGVEAMDATVQVNGDRARTGMAAAQGGGSPSDPAGEAGVSTVSAAPAEAADVVAEAPTPAITDFEEATSAEPIDDVASAGPEGAAAPEAPAPSIDTIRVEPDGTGLVAGQAEPGASVALLADDDVAVEATADADGRFVAFFALEPSAQPRVLSLRDDNGGLSAETVIVAPNVMEEQVASLEPSPAQVPDFQDQVPASVDLIEGQGSEASIDADARNSSVPVGAPAVGQPPSADPSTPPEADRSAAVAEAPAASAVPVVPGPEAPSGPESELAPAAAAPELATAAPEPPAPMVTQPPAQEAVLLSDAKGVRVVQPALPPGASPEVLATVALDAIAYDGSGEVLLSGRATADGAVRLYLDNAPVAEASIAPDGTWSVPLTGTAAGRYTLRVDQLDVSGAVVSRIETPFQREERVSLEAAMAEAGRISNGIALRTVQPGNTLWAIARERYGEPRLYLRVFEANRDRIRNPDLIYPGQVFVLPDFE